MGKPISMSMEFMEAEQPTEIVDALGKRRSSKTAVVAMAAVTVVVAGTYLLWSGDTSSESARPGALVSEPLDGSKDDRADDSGPDEPAQGRDNSDESDPDGSDADDARSGKNGSLSVSAGPRPRGQDGKNGQACQAHLYSRPRGAAVFKGKRKLGTAPLVARLPCGKNTLRFERKRYQTIEQKIDLVADDRNNVTVRLQRPQVKLEVTSDPRGATVTWEGKRLGETPLATEIDGYIPDQLVISKRGHRSYRKRINPRPPRVEVDAKLRPR